MKQPSRLSVPSSFSYVNNYDAQEMAAMLNESVCKVAKEAQANKVCKKIEEEVTTKLTVHFNNEWAQKKVALKNELVV